ncbi:hypothetical protein ACSQ67_004364 [Phaseolus vulgaris]
MDNFPDQFSATTTNPLILEQQSMGELKNVNFPVDNSGHVGFPDPYYAPFDQNMQFQQVNQYPLHTLQTGQPNAIYGAPNSEVQGWSQQQPEEEEYRKSVGTLTSKVARDKRKQVRQKSKSVPVAPLVPTKGIIKEQPVPGGGSDGKLTINQDRIFAVFCSPDGKKLEEVFTKQLKNSDVSVLGRIVLPKREVEAKLPPLTDKEGKDIMVKDVYSGMIWTLKYKYWSNNRSRMYVLENAGDLVNHYELQMGDLITIYEDERKNLKKRNPEGAVSLSKKEVEDANNLLTSINGGGSSSSGAKLGMNIAERDQLSNIAGNGAPSQTTIEAAPPAPPALPAPLGGNNQWISDEDVYGGLDNIFEIENSFHSFDHLKDYKTWPY